MLLEILLTLYIVGDLVTAIDMTLVFKDDLITSALKTLCRIKRMHKKRKNLHKVKKSTQPSDNSVSLNIKDNRKKSRPSTRKKNARGKEDEIVFVGIHSRLVYFLFLVTILLRLII